VKSTAGEPFRKLVRPFVAHSIEAKGTVPLFLSSTGSICGGTEYIWDRPRHLLFPPTNHNPQSCEALFSCALSRGVQDIFRLFPPFFPLWGERPPFLDIRNYGTAYVGLRVPLFACQIDNNFSSPPLTFFFYFFQSRWVLLGLCVNDSPLSLSRLRQL